MKCNLHHVTLNMCLLVWFQRNYRSFILFVTTSTILCIYVFTFSLMEIIKQPGSVWRSMSNDIISIILIGYCFIAVWFVGGLSVFHVYLMCTNQVRFLFVEGELSYSICFHFFLKLRSWILVNSQLNPLCEFKMFMNE